MPGLMDRATLLTYTWEYVAVAIIAIAGVRAYRAGSLATGTLMMVLAGAFLLAFGLRDHLYRDKREMRANADSRFWLALTGFAVVVVSYSLAVAVGRAL